MFQLPSFHGVNVEVIPGMRLIFYIGQPHGYAWVQACRLAKAAGYDIRPIC